jgi:hypothetical protein
MQITAPSRLSDNELMAEVARLAQGERDATVSLVAHLTELYGRRLHERAGYSSLFTYCLEALRLSEHEAYDRMKAAKVARRYPAVLALLAAGRVNLTTIRLVAPRLTRENHPELLAAVSGKRKREVQEVLARMFPQKDAPPSMRRLPAPRVPSTPVPTPIGQSGGAAAVPPPWSGSLDERPCGEVGTLAPLVAGAAVRPSIPPPPRDLVRPLSADRYQVTFTASAAVCEKLELAKDLLRHAVPGGDPAQVVERALDVLIAELVKQKYAVSSRPRESPGQAQDSRNVPADVKRPVYIRDCGRCAYVAPDGRRCGERGFVEFHHVVPYAAGGRPTVDNIELRCRAHNGYEAEVFYGPGKRYGAEAVKEPRAAYACHGGHVFVPERQSVSILAAARRPASKRPAKLDSVVNNSSIGDA